MTTLLLRFSGPMQSWGTQSRFSYRDTGLEPSKSGVIGLLCAALGRPRDVPVDDLAALNMGVRVDREGVLRSDYHTAGGWHRQQDAGYGVPGPDGRGRRTVISHRYYLADAEFLIGLEGDADLLSELDAAVRQPVWQLFLGRKSFPPGAPLYVPTDEPWGPSLRDAELEPTLRSYPWLGHLRPAQRRLDDDDKGLRIVIDTNQPRDAEVRPDVPLSFEQRRFTTRYVRTDWVTRSELEEPCTSHS